MSAMKNVHWGFSIRDIFRAVFGIEQLPPPHPCNGFCWTNKYI